MIDKPGPIIVTGCQRSGTMLAANIIATGLGYGLLEEFDVLPEKGGLPLIAKFLYEQNKVDVVIQAPFALQIYKQLLPLVPGIHFVGMVRPKQDILNSMRRIEWCKDDCDDWDKYLDEHVNKMKKLWKQLKKDVCPSNWTELQYKDLEGHPFFVNKQDRKNFTVKQWQINKPCQFKTWSNNSRCIKDRIKENK